MKNVIEILERYFNSFINTERSKDFFFGLADYVDYIQNTPELNKIVKSLFKKRGSLLNKIRIYEKKTLQELKLSKRKLLEIIKKNKLSFEKLNQRIKNLKDYENGKTKRAGAKSNIIEEYLFDIARVFSISGYKNLLNEFIDDNRYPKNIYGNFVFSKSLKKRRELNDQYFALKKTDLWGCWDRLEIVPFLILKNEGFDEIFSKKGLGTVDAYFELMEAIENPIPRHPILTKQPIFSEEREINNQYGKLNYRNYTIRIHNYLIKELKSEEAEKTPKKKIKKTKTKYSNGILYFQNKEINFRNQPNQKDLLKTLFTKPEKNWSYDEIQEDWDKFTNWEQLPKTYWKKFYNAGYDINKAIAMETQIKDFIIKNTKEIRINLQYL